jgi:hypothetical protein
MVEVSERTFIGREWPACTQAAAAPGFDNPMVPTQTD